MKEDENEKITKMIDLFNEFAQAENDDEGWYMYYSGFRKAFKKRNKEIIGFLKYNTGLKIDAEMITNLTEKLK